MFETELPNLPEMLSSLTQGLLLCSNLKPNFQVWMPPTTWKNSPFQSIQGFRLANTVPRGAQRQWECHWQGEARSSQTALVLLVVPAGNSMLSERHGGTKYLIGKAATTSAPLERAVCLVPISMSGLWDGSKGVHKNRDVRCRVEEEPALIRRKKNTFLSTPTSWISKMSYPRW